MNSIRWSQIIGTGIYLPEKKLTNFDLEKMVDTSDEWIYTRTGIKERRIVEPHQKLSDIAIPAAQMALKNANIPPEKIDMIILATFTADRPISATACLIQEKLGCVNAAAFDIEVACSGFVYALSIAHQFIATRTMNYILVIGADILSKFLDFTDRASCVLFGDGAGACVVGPSEDPNTGIFDLLLGADGSGYEHIRILGGGSEHPASEDTVKNRMHYIQMNGKEVFKFSTRIVGDMIEKVLKKNNLNLDDVSLIIPHQANIRILESAANRFNCPMSKFYTNLEKYGNTVAGTIPICLHEALLEKKIKKGDTILLVGFGGGLTYGLVALRWGDYVL